MLGLDYINKQRIFFWIPYFISIILYTYNGMFTFVSTFMVILFPGVVAGLFLIYNYKMVLKIYVIQFIYLGTTMLIKLIILIFQGLYYQEGVLTRNYGYRNWGEIIIELGLIILIGCVHKNIKINSTYYTRKVYVVLFVVGVFEAVMLGYLMMLSSEKVSFSILLLSVLSVVCFIVTLMLFLIYMLNQKNLEERRMLLLRQRSLEERYDMMESQYEETMKLRHDIKVERKYLYQCIIENKLEEGIEYLKERINYEQPLNRIWTGIKIIDFIIDSKTDIIEKQKIEFSIKNDCEWLPISDGDFCIILENLLDNAIEAVIKENEGKRHIRLNLCHRNNLFCIYLENDCLEKPKVVERRLISTKDNKIIHGWGMENVKSIVSKYDGTFNYEFSNEKFTVTVIFWNVNISRKKE